MGFELEGVGLFLEREAEVDVVDEPTADVRPLSVGGLAGWRHAVAHEDGRIVGRHDRNGGMFTSDLFGFVPRLRPPFSQISFLGIGDVTLDGRVI